MPPPSSEAELAAVTRALIAQVQSSAKTWSFDPDRLFEPLAAAGLLRAGKLLDETLYLAERPPSAGANILVRAAFEFWLLGAWALFGEVEAVIGIDLARLRQEHNLAVANGLEEHVIEHLERQQRVLAEAQVNLLGGVEPRSVRLEQLAERLGPVIKAKTGEDADLLTVYNMIYRTHSTNDAHPPKVIGQLLQDHGETIRVVDTEPWMSPFVSACTMAMYVGLLGRWIEQSLGGDPAAWDALVDATHSSLDRFPHDAGAAPG